MKKNILSNKKRKRFLNNILTLLLVSGIFIMLFAGCGGTSKTPGPETPPDSQGTEEARKDKSAESKYIKAGMYKVGTDISQGEYLIYSQDSLAYFQVSKDSSGSLESIITNDNFQGTRYVTVKDGQYLELRDSRMLPVSEAPVQNPQNRKYVDGMYKAGRDIKAGEYKVVSSGTTAYYEVASNSGGGIESIVTNDNFEGEKYITIKDGQYIKLNGCTIPAK